MKTLKPKYLRPVICLILGTALLSAAVFANYDNANGYEACKTSLKNMLYLDNVSLDMVYTVSMDDEPLLIQRNSVRLAGGNDAFYQTSNSYENLIDNTSSEYRCTSQDKVEICENRFPSGETSKIMTPGYRKKDNVAFLSDDDVTAKAVNFAEAAADTMVGDLKNSFVLIGRDDDTKTYRVNLSAEQLPDIVTSGVSLMVAGVKETNEQVTAENSADYRIYSSIMGSEKDPYIDSAKLTVTLGNDGTVRDLNGEIALLGFDNGKNPHTLTVSVSVRAYDFGTTSIERIDTSDARNIPDKEYAYTEETEVSE